MVGNFVKGDEELLREFDKALLDHKVQLPEHSVYFKMKKSLENNENTISEINKNIKELNIKIVKCKTKKQKKPFLSEIKKNEKLLKNLTIQNSQIIKDMNEFDGYYIQKKKASFKEKKIILSQGHQNTFTGGMSIKVLTLKPHLYLFMPQKFSLPNSTKKLTIGSESLYDEILQLYEKCRLLFSILWSTDSLCIHLLTFAKLRLTAFWRARCKHYPYKVCTWKEHYLICHAFPRLLERKSLAREGEEAAEHNMQVISKVSKRVRTIHNAQKRLELKLKFANLHSKEHNTEIIGKRKICKTCNKYINRRWSPFCKCINWGV